MTTPVVLDVSAGVEIALGTARGRALSRLLPAGATLWAPEHYFAETASALRRLEVIERKLDAVTTLAAMQAASRLVRRRVNVRPLVDEAWQYRFNISLGDALYVVVAKHLGCPLLTGDRRLAGAPTLPVQVLHISGT